MKEDVYFYLDLTKDLIKKKDIIKAIKYYVEEKNKININPKEVADFKWININELKKDIKENPEKYSPWFKIECEELFSNYLNEIEELFVS